MASIVGTWQLCSWSALWAHELEDGEGSVERWLYQETSPHFSEVDEEGDATGSLLTIHDDGRFSQTGRGSFPVVSYDAEGIQVSGVAEFDGDLRDDGERSYLLRRELPAWATPKDPVAQTRVRWDNGDTKVCDSVKLLDGRLVRMTCVATDECYGDRILLVYERA